MGEVPKRNIPLAVFVDTDMQNDLQWLVDHYKEFRPELNLEIGDVAYYIIDMAIEEWHARHSHTGVCGQCTAIRVGVWLHGKDESTVK